MYVCMYVCVCVGGGPVTIYYLVCNVISDDYVIKIFNA